MTSERKSDPDRDNAPGRVVAIDGPAASGKSSVARELARRIGFVHVDTGAMYRAVTWLALQRGVPPDDTAAMETLLDGVSLEAEVRNGRAWFTLDGIDPTRHLRSEPVNAAVSLVARLPGVRRRLVTLQRLCAQARDVVMEGRDIGSVVFPNTPFKFYIDASPEVRSGRRAAEGHSDQIAARDRLDASRSSSPLVAAPGALVIDSSHLDLAAVIALVLEQLAARGIRPLPGMGSP